MTKKQKKSAWYFNKLLNKLNTKSADRIQCPLCSEATSGKQLLRHLYFGHALEFKTQRFNKQYKSQILELEREVVAARQQQHEQRIIEEYGSLEEAEKARGKELLEKAKIDQRNAALGVLDPESTKSPASDVTWATRK
jgi:tRNA/tmRNA/rRNA uracil-C5-methylase (TrmA/RlmC/RlmD family)